MEFIIEFILELVLEGSIEVSKNSKISKYIRYPLIVIISSFIMGVIGLIFFVGILSLEENLFLGIFLIIIGAVMLLMSVIKFRKIYLFKPKGK